MRRVLLLASVLLINAPAFAQGLHEQAQAKVRALSVEIKSHSDASRAAGTDAQRALAAGERAKSCAAFKTSRAEAAKVLELLAQQREQVLLATPDVATGVMQASRIDDMTGSWMKLAAQLDERLPKVCA